MKARTWWKWRIYLFRIALILYLPLCAVMNAVWVQFFPNIGIFGEFLIAVVIPASILMAFYYFAKRTPCVSCGKRKEKAVVSTECEQCRLLWRTLEMRRTGKIVYLVAAIGVGFLILILYPSTSSFPQVDRCLDGGGCWDYKVQVCRKDEVNAQELCDASRGR